MGQYVALEIKDTAGQDFCIFAEESFDAGVLCIVADYPDGRVMGISYAFNADDVRIEEYEQSGVFLVYLNDDGRLELKLNRSNKEKLEKLVSKYSEED